MSKKQIYIILSIALLIAVAFTVNKIKKPEVNLSTSQAANKTLLTQNDITYVGAFRMPAGVDTNFAYGGIAGRVVNDQLRFFVLGNITRGGRIYEITDPGSYNRDYNTAPRATLVTDWGTVYMSALKTWNPDGTEVRDVGIIPAGMYWNDNTGLLYVTYTDTYNVAGRSDWGLMAISLDNPTTATKTAYGPWRMKATDGNGRTWYGPWRCLYLFNNPIDGSLACGSRVMSGNANAPWGPDMYSGAAWPTASIPGGFGNPDITLPNRYLEYYFGGFPFDGSPTNPIRQFRRTVLPSFIYIFLPVCRSGWTCTAEGAGLTLNVDPTKNNGVGTWTELDGTGGMIWLELPNKQGVIAAMTLVGGYSTDPYDCVNAGREWYSNVGLGRGDDPYGCPAIGITGPISTRSAPFFGIFDPDELIQVKNGVKTDYTVEAKTLIDLETTYGVATAPIKDIGAGKFIDGFYFDATRNYLFVVARHADMNGLGSNSPTRTSLIHVFRINDATVGVPPTPAPTPSPSPSPSPTPPPTGGPTPSPTPTPTPPPTGGPTPPPTGEPCTLVMSGTDALGHVWTISFGWTLRDGTYSLPGGGSLPGANGTTFMFVDGIVHVKDSRDNLWYRWNESIMNWVLVGATQPVCTVPAPAPAPAPVPVPPPAVGPIVGDLDNNGIVNSLDWSIMSGVWFTSNAQADLNHDGIVNSIDFSIMNRNWLKTN